MSVNKAMPVLVVDDNATMRRIICGLLRQIGFTNLGQAKDGEEALEVLNKDKYDLIISDWNMEPMSGIDLLKHVRANDNYKEVPFLMVTAESRTSNVKTAIDCGVSNYIVKPFNAKVLKDKLCAVLGDFS